MLFEAYLIPEIISEAPPERLTAEPKIVVTSCVSFIDLSADYDKKPSESHPKKDFNAGYPPIIYCSIFKKIFYKICKNNEKYDKIARFFNKKAIDRKKPSESHPQKFSEYKAYSMSYYL